MDTIFVRDGVNVRLGKPVLNENLMDHLSPKVYRISGDDKGLFLQPLRDKFSTPEKIYGNHHARKTRILDHYRSMKSGPLGAIFVGAKGCGKSLLAEDIANNLLEQGIPTLYIDENIRAEALKHVVGSCGPLCVIFEEFSKHYDEGKGGSGGGANQEQLLSMFSDRSLDKVLFLLVDNVTDGVSDFLFDRPQRFYYFMRFKPNSADIFKEMSAGKVIKTAVRNYIQYGLAGRPMIVRGIDSLHLMISEAEKALSVSWFVEAIEDLNVHELSPWTLDLRVETSEGDAVPLRDLSVSRNGVEYESGHRDMWNDALDEEFIYVRHDPSGAVAMIPCFGSEDFSTIIQTRAFGGDMRLRGSFTLRDFGECKSGLNVVIYVPMVHTLKSDQTDDSKDVKREVGGEAPIHTERGVVTASITTDFSGLNTFAPAAGPGARGSMTYSESIDGNKGARRDEIVKKWAPGISGFHITDQSGKKL